MDIYIIVFVPVVLLFCINRDTRAQIVLVVSQFRRFYCQQNLWIVFHSSDSAQPFQHTLICTSSTRSLCKHQLFELFDRIFVFIIENWCTRCLICSSCSFVKRGVTNPGQRMTRFQENANNGVWMLIFWLRNNNYSHDNWMLLEQELILMTCATWNHKRFINTRSHVRITCLNILHEMSMDMMQLHGKNKQQLFIAMRWKIGFECWY